MTRCICSTAYIGSGVDFLIMLPHRKVKCSPKVLCPTFWGALHFWGLLLFRDFVSDRETGILFQVFRNECTQFFSSDVLG